jgi:hypothetical protein
VVIHDIPGKLRPNDEPLQRFGEAKKSMGNIYNELSGYVDELHEFYSGEFWNQFGSTINSDQRSRLIFQDWMKPARSSSQPSK